MPQRTIINTVRFTNSSNEPFNPSVVSVTVSNEGGVVGTYSVGGSYPPAQVTNPSVGEYVLKIDWTVGTFFKVEWNVEDAQGKGYHSHSEFVGA